MAERARKIDDAGEKIGGARKDRWKDRTLTVADLDDLSPEEAGRYVTKDLIWPPPDYAGMIEGGVDVTAAALVRVCRDRLRAAPELRTRDLSTRQLRDARKIHSDYIRMMEMARDRLMACRTVADVEAVDMAFAPLRHSRDPETRHLRDSISKDSQAPFYIGSKEKARARKLIEEGFPGSVPAWRKGATIRQDSDDGTWYVARKRMVVASGLESEDAALEWLKADHAASKKQKLPEPERPHLDRLERSGMPDWREGRSVTPDEFIGTFGFRGVEFGNWLPDDERQRVLDMAYDALRDLAHVMGMEPRAMSFEGRLAIAFGARGEGSHAAHYEAERTVINITRLSGAGSLAHEFAHAFDHMCGEIDQAAPSRGEVRSGSGWRTPSDTRLHATAHLGIEAAKAWDAMMRTLKQRPKTRDEAIAEVRADLEARVPNLDKHTRTLASYLDRTPAERRDKKWVKRMETWIAAQPGIIAKRQARIEELSRMPDRSDFGTADSHYLSEAAKISGSGDYWIRPNELFARAFESVIFDRLEAMGARSDYLVHGVEEDRFADAGCWRGNPYPSGEERARIASALDGLFEAVVPRLNRDVEPEQDLGPRL